MKFGKACLCVYILIKTKMFVCLYICIFSYKYLYIYLLLHTLPLKKNYSNRYSIGHLKLAIKIPWYPWYVKKQVGGWIEVYEGLTFATVRGAGHEVPLFKPRAALELFRSFLKGLPLLKS